MNPFFTGGGQISVSYPTNTMDYDARIQSMRGNNPGFSHATAHHEMIPGHNLVGFLGDALQRLPRQPERRRPVLRRGLAALLGADALRPGLQQDARAEGRRALLAHAPLRAHHLLAQVPHGPVVAAGGRSTSSSIASATSARTRPPKSAARSIRRPATARSIRRRICSVGCSCAACAGSSSTRSS